MNTQNTVIYTKTETGKNLMGVIYMPKGTGKNSMKYFDAILHGVPVEISSGKKIIDQDRWEKLLEKNMVNEKDLYELEFNSCTFENVTFEGLSLYNVSFKGCTFLSCSFDKARLSDCLFVECELDNCSFVKGSYYIDSKFCHFLNCSFMESYMANSHLDKCRLVSCEFVLCKIRRGSFYKCDLEKPNFSYATLDGIYFHGCTITDADYDSISLTMGGATSEEVANYQSCIIGLLN